MYTRVFEREDETVNISEYGFEWYKGNKLVKTGLVENIDNDVESLINEGFVEII